MFGRDGRRWTKGERGSATVEFAVVLPAIALVLGFLGMAAQYGVAAIRAQEAASAAARIAIADTDDRAREAAWRIVGGDARIGIVRDDDWIRVSVVDPGPMGLEASATAVVRAQD